MGVINGTRDGDNLSDTMDDDDILGRGGDDAIYSTNAGADILRGNAGDDYLVVYRNSDVAAAKITMLGGADDDDLVWDVLNQSVGFLDGGAGDDDFSVYANAGALTIKTGAGEDAIYFNDVLDVRAGGSIVIQDFDVRADTLDILQFLQRNLTNWDGENPFGSGHLRLVQSGKSTLLQIDLNGGGDNYVTLATFNGVSAKAFSADHFSGYEPDGSAPVGDTFNGTRDSEELVGTQGDDTINGDAGADYLNGQAGDDNLNGGGGDDYIVGGMGDDVMRGQGGSDFLISGGSGRSEKSKDGSADITDYGDDIMHGNGGDDDFYIGRGEGAPASDIKAYGGADEDVFIYDVVNDSTGYIDAGTGDDVIFVYANAGDLTIRTGTGRDIISLDLLDLSTADTGTVTVTDFTVGEGGDVISVLGLTEWFEGDNPIAEGYLNILQRGKDAVLQIDLDGGGDDFFDVVVLKNVDLDDLTESNLIPDSPDPFRTALLDTSDHALI